MFSPATDRKREYDGIKEVGFSVVLQNRIATLRHIYLALVPWIAHRAAVITRAE